MTSHQKRIDSTELACWTSTGNHGPQPGPLMWDPLHTRCIQRWLCQTQVGEGHWGHGSPLSARLLGQTEVFRDGFDLCSPRRWRASQRRCADDVPC